MTKVSILMPVYKTPEAYLREAIESILNQTFTDYEFIIIDDGSTEKHIKKVVQSYKDKRIKYFYKDNSGVADSLNYGMKKSTGEYIARMDSDDISLPTRLEKQVKYLDEHKDISLLGSWFETFPNSKLVKTITRPKILDFLVENQIGHPTVMFRKMDFVNNNLWYNKEFASEDYELWSRAVQVLNIDNLQEVLLRYRVHNQNISKIKEDEIIESDKKIKSNILNNFSSSKKTRKRLETLVYSYRNTKMLYL